MWKHFSKEQLKEFILSLDLINGDFSDDKKINLLYAIANHPEKYYTKKYIKKRNGTKRELLVPDPILKNIQKNILNNVLYGLNVSKYATGYIKNKSLSDNATMHVNKKIVLKLDMKDFFSSILFENLYKTLPNYIFPPSVKVLLIKLCTYEDYLPQGAPTSPYLSNLVMKNFDEYIGSYCDKENISYTRYCDDLTFSGDFDAKKLKHEVVAFIEELGFNINQNKTRILSQNNRQIVTGIVVNEKMNLLKNYQKKIRQEMYYINRYGMDNHCKFLKVNKENYINRLIGRINYCLQITKNKEYENYLKILKNIKKTCYNNS